MPIDVYLSFVAYACATTFLPGPNNVLMLTAAGQNGLKKCMKLLLGIWSGLVTVMIIAGTFCSILSAFVPKIAPFFKYVGAGYIVYLAWMTLKKKPAALDDSAAKKTELNWSTGFLLQFLNVKVIMLGLAAYPGYFMPYGPSIFIVLLFAVTMTACCGTGNLIWATVGNFLYPVYSRCYKVVNAVMALLLVYCAVKIIMTA